MFCRSRWWSGVVVFAALMLCLLSTGTGVAQTFRGSVLGTVTDSSGAAIVGARVSVMNRDTGLERHTVTTEDGGYLVPELPAGTYNVTITMTGFQGSITNGVQVTVASQKRVDVALKPGAVSQNVEVSAERNRWIRPATCWEEC